MTRPAPSAARSRLALFVAVVCASATAASAAPFVTQVRNGSVVNGDPTQNGRLVPNGTASVAGVAKPFPGVANAGSPFRYDAFAFTNTEPFALPIAVTLDATSGADFGLLPVAYLSSYDPGNIATNYAGDPGSGPAIGAPVGFSLVVPANTTFLVVVSETNLGASANPYTLTVGLLPEPTTLAAGGAAGLVLRRRRRVAR